ncbi:MAG: NAD-dependent epimerase/dehydratase family protein [Bacilli bacterium]|nr:NAD-dependent epimerase/dehydratase family protein [Bacilli bacterium]
MNDILKNTIYNQDLKKALMNIDLSKLKKQSILITGGLGLICSTIVDLLIVANTTLDLCIDIFVADINEEFYKRRYGSYLIKYLKYNALESLNFDDDFDYIIHGAGLASPDLYINAPVETMLSNFIGVLNLLNYAKEKGTKRMLYISSSEVYGNTMNGDSFDEDAFGIVGINTVRSSYCEAKRASEVLCRSFTSEFGLETVIVRPGHVFGPTASPNDKRVSSVFAYQAARGETLELKSTGLQKRSYCYSIDCAVAILIALLNGKSGESYNIGHDEVTTIRQMAEIIAAAANVVLRVKEPTEEELKSFNPMSNSVLNNEKIKKIGYSDTFTVEEGLLHTVRILKELYYS